MHLRKTVVEGRMSVELRRQLRDEARPIVAISGATAHHAQLAEAAGFRYFVLSGSQAAAHVLGLPDAGLMTLTEAAENLRRVCQSVSIPVMADCETGFGSVVNTTRAVFEFISAGAAGLFIEDQVFPKRCGFTKGLEVISIEDTVAKLKAAKAERDRLDPDVVIMARTDARAAVGGSVEEVLRRCEAYLEAGADMLMVMALQTREEMAQIVGAFPGRDIYVNASAIKPPLSHEEYRAFGVATYNISLSKAAQMMQQRFLSDCRERGMDAYNAFLDEEKASPSSAFEYLELTGFPAVVELERRFLPEASLRKYDASLGEYDPRG